MLLVTIFVLLWLLLLIIPGIIASIAYSQVFFIIAEDDKIDAMGALRKSQKMMAHTLRAGIIHQFSEANQSDIDRQRKIPQSRRQTFCRIKRRIQQ